MACKLIPLDKNPGLRPIGIGEILRRIIGKTIMMNVKQEVSKSVGSLQTCAGQEAGIEATIHAMREIFEDESNEGIILVDASNAFNSVNREAFLHNIKIICPPLAIFTNNCYSINARLFVIGGYELTSKEGTTQGDPIAMAVYAIAIIPMILMLVETYDELNNTNPTKVVGYADDIASAGKIKKLKNWWYKVCELGPKFGYFPESKKSWLIVKPEKLEEAKKEFGETMINITTEGRRYLGGSVGSDEFKNVFAEEKILDLTRQIEKLSQIAMYEPQAAYSAFFFGFKHKITYLMRSLPNISKELEKLDEIISRKFIPAITGGINCSKLERKLLSLPPKLGGLGIPLFSNSSDVEHNNSLSVTEVLKNNIKNQNPQLKIDENIKKKKQQIKKSKRENQNVLLQEIRDQMSPNQSRLNDLASEKHASLWITTLPIRDEGYILSKQQF